LGTNRTETGEITAVRAQSTQVRADRNGAVGRTTTTIAAGGALLGDLGWEPVALAA
jgi:hypothetical protein